ncbi:MAG: lytic transglycosylase domain-containing protein [Roseicyclus sp.]
MKLSPPASRHLRALACVLCFWLAATLPASAARGTPAEVCDQAARAAAAETGVPVQVLRAIARTETGRTRDGTFGPWPWTVNHAGRGLWFESPDETLGYLAEARRQGARNFDVGCFQVNFHWHGHAFPSLADMLDPERNARYAARFLTDLRAELGDWDRAVGAFHSRTPEHADRYLQRFHRIRAALSDPAAAPPTPVQPAPATRPPPRAPQGLDMRPRGSLFASARPGGGNPAPLFSTAPARPLWETFR